MKSKKIGKKSLQNVWRKRKSKDILITQNSAKCKLKLCSVFDEFTSNLVMLKMSVIFTLNYENLEAIPTWKKM